MGGWKWRWKGTLGAISARRVKFCGKKKGKEGGGEFFEMYFIDRRG